MSNPEPVTPQVSVKPTAAPIVMSESTKAALIALAAILAYHFIKSEAVLGVLVSSMGALIAGLAGVLAYGNGLLHRLRCWKALKFMANRLPDDVAKVGK